MVEQAHSFDDSAAYERFMGRWSRAVGTDFLDWLASPLCARWLEVGCGTGVFTELVLDMCSPETMIAVDSAQAQINHACHQPPAERATFRVADAQALPFADATFDIVVSALTINFIPDRHRALTEMRRVLSRGGLVAGYIWDFEAEFSPSWPLRRGMRKFGLEIPEIPGTRESGLGALVSMFERAGFEMIVTKCIDVTLPFPDFDTFWQAQTPSYNPTTKMIDTMSKNDRERLIETVRAGMPISADGRIAYSARANAIKARAPS
jgi:ubiquinone/menaquinone biosynthesis C-methylase UbiE